MKVTQEKLPASQVSLTIEVPAELSGKAYENTLKQFARSVRLPGFRQGKVPRHVLIQQVGPLALKAATLDEVVELAVKEALKQEKLEPAGQAQVADSETDLLTRFEPGEAFEFTATIDVFPDVVPPEYTGITVKAEEGDPKLNRIDDLIEQQRLQSATLLPVSDRPAQVGDVANIDFKGELLPKAADDSAKDAASEDAEGEEGEDDEEIDLSGLEASNFQVDLDETKFIPDFVAGIVGMAPGESKDVTVTFPDDYARRDLAGRQVKFAITLHDLKERELPEVDDDFIRSVSQYQTVQELRESLENRYREEANRETEGNKQAALMKELVDRLELELPEGLIRQRVESNLRQSLASLQEQGIDIDQFVSEELLNNLREVGRPEAIFQVKADLLVRQIGRQENLEVSPQEVKAQAREVQSIVGRKVDRKRLESIVYEDLFKQKVMTWLEEQNSFELVPPGTLTTKTEADAEAPEGSEATEPTDGEDS